MAFGTDRFWAAFRRVGMLQTASWDGGPDFDVQFEQPQRLEGSVGAFTTDYAIEYQVADAPGLALNSLITIDGQAYKVNQRPEKRGDGAFAVASLEKHR